MTLKPYLPKSLFWRSVLIVVAPMVILQAVLAYLIVQRHFDGVTRQMTDNVAAEIGYLVELVDSSDSPETADAAMEQATDALGFEIDLLPRATLPPYVQPLFFDVISIAVAETFKKRLRRPLFIDFVDGNKALDLRVQTRHGVVTAILPKRRLIASNPHLLLTWMAATAAALIAISLVYLRNQIRPIQTLARAADAFGKGRILDLRPSGASEVRLASSAFLEMRERIERHLEQRTAMLSGVSHDMRTPLTRMKLALEMMDETPEIAELRHDVEQLEHILEEFLAYARGDRSENAALVDLERFVEEVAAERRRSGDEIGEVAAHIASDAREIRLRPQAMKRALHNLLGNAAKYGGAVRLAVVSSAEAVVFSVEDDGPGIPPHLRADALRPFTRLEEGRNQNRGGGVGLGLSLALDAFRSHGGDLTLHESEALGGLKAVGWLPR